MARDEASKVLVFLTIYFVFLFSITLILVNVGVIYDLEDSDEYTAGRIDLEYSTGFVSGPRVNSNGNKIWSAEKFGSLSLLQSKGIIESENDCNYYYGSNWTQQSSFWGLIGIEDYVCEGNINLSYYDEDENFLYDYVDEEVGILEEGGRICDLSSLDTEDEAYKFGCTWYPPHSNTFGDDVKFSSITDILGDIFTMSINFTTENTLVNFLLNFIFILLPFIVMLLAGYVMIR